MTIQNALDIFDARNTNEIDDIDKIKWLSDLDGSIKENIIDTHEGTESVIYEPYNNDTDRRTQLLVKEPYTELYIHWLMCQMYLNRGEVNLYNNAVELYNQSYSNFARYYNRTHMPKQKAKISGFKGW
ncbi:MAG: hypothetical protein NC110_08180 [Ruminococcus sp.]|nr:hypothetical protein [Ruminococcus sp.]